MAVNSHFIRRRDDSKTWFRRETAEPWYNIKYDVVGPDTDHSGEFLAVKPKMNANSVWDEAQWPTTYRYPEGHCIVKKEAKEKFMLMDQDIIDLCYRKRPQFIPGRGTFMTKQYLCRQLERRAWEKFGGPEGMAKAREIRDDRRERRAIKLAASGAPAIPPTNRPKKRAAPHKAAPKKNPATGRRRGRPSTQKKDVPAPKPLLSQLDELSKEIFGEQQEGSPSPPPTTVGTRKSPILIDLLEDGDSSDDDLPTTPKTYKSLGFLDLTLSDSNSDEMFVSPSKAGEPEVIELID